MVKAARGQEGKAARGKKGSKATRGKGSKVNERQQGHTEKDKGSKQGRERQTSWLTCDHRGDTERQV